MIIEQPHCFYCFRVVFVLNCDASGKLGFAAIYGTQWLVGTWSTKDNLFHMAWTELVPITLAF